MPRFICPEDGQVEYIHSILPWAGPDLTALLHSPWEIRIRKKLNGTSHNFIDIASIKTNKNSEELKFRSLVFVNLLLHVAKVFLVEEKVRGWQIFLFVGYLESKENTIFQSTFVRIMSYFQNPKGSNPLHCANIRRFHIISWKLWISQLIT